MSEELPENDFPTGKANIGY